MYFFFLYYYSVYFGDVWMIQKNLYFESPDELIQLLLDFVAFESFDTAKIPSLSMSSSPDSPIRSLPQKLSYLKIFYLDF